MSCKLTYQELANATLAKTQLGAVTQPYAPFNDNALATNEMRSVTDRLAQETRANQNTEAQVSTATAEAGLPPNLVQQVVNQQESQQRFCSQPWDSSSSKHRTHKAAANSTTPSS